MQIVDQRGLLIETPEPEAVARAIVKSKVIDSNKVLVNWGLDETRQLAALGFKDAPSPILRDYVWTGRYTPFDHQRTTASFLTANDKAFCFSELGTGKTASAIWAADYLMKRGEVRRALVLCPLSIMKSAWERDLFTFAMHRSCAVAHGSKAQRLKALAANTDFVVVNFDGLAVIKNEVLTGGFDLIIVDEASAYKNTQTARWKIMNEVASKVPRLWMMTGTPAAQSPMDAYGLAKLVNPKGVPKFYSVFRDEVMYKATQFKWVPRPNSQHRVHQVLQPAIRFEKKDCLDLPDVVHAEREAPLTPMQQRYYDLLRKQMLFEAAGESVSAVNAAANINKLLQISGGAVYSDDGSIVEFDVSNRLNVVTEIIDESSHKVLVFVPFTHTIELLREHLLKQGYTCAVINGKVPVNARAQIIDDFQTKPDPRILLLQPQAASHGLTLTAADTIIWYSPVTSVETYLQANGRINRPGQKNNMTIVHVKGSPVEDRLYSMLSANIDNHEKLIDLYRSSLSDA